MDRQAKSSFIIGNVQRLMAIGLILYAFQPFLSWVLSAVLEAITLSVFALRLFAMRDSFRVHRLLGCSKRRIHLVYLELDYVSSMSTFLVFTLLVVYGLRLGDFLSLCLFATIVVGTMVGKQLVLLLFLRRI